MGDHIDIHLAEYGKLKDEQIHRIGYRDGLIRGTLVLIGAVVSFIIVFYNGIDLSKVGSGDTTVQVSPTPISTATPMPVVKGLSDDMTAIQEFMRRSLPGILLFLPIITSMLGLMYLLNDEKISEIGAYFRDVLRPKLESGGVDGVFTWETAYRKTVKRKRYKVMQLILNEMLFCLSGVLSIGLYFKVTGKELCNIGWLYCIILLIGLVLSGWIGVELLLNFDNGSASINSQIENKEAINVK